jgi:putative hydrolase of the HAD superfamily
VSQHENQCLLVDADDTLWENHRYFVDVFERFLSLMTMRGHDPVLAGRLLRDMEAKRTVSHGYGSRNFASSLIETAVQLEGSSDRTLEQCLQNEGEWIFHHPIEVFPGVSKSLEQLTARHQVHLVTKGNPVEQQGKIERSGLASFFRTIHVLREKDGESYRALVLELGAAEDSTWMIGNSPRSDMNPARKAGLRTVFIPHRTIWELEDAKFEETPNLRLTRFAELCHHF